MATRAIENRVEIPCGVEREPTKFTDKLQPKRVTELRRRDQQIGNRFDLTTSAQEVRPIKSTDKVPKNRHNKQLLLAQKVVPPQLSLRSQQIRD